MFTFFYSLRIRSINANDIIDRADYSSLLLHSSNRKKYTKCFHFSHSKFSNPNNITDDWQCLNEWKISLRLAKFKENYSLPFIRFVSIEPTYTSLLLHSSNRKTFIRNVFTFLILNFPNNIFDDWQCSNKGKISFRELFTSFHKKRYKTFSLLNFPNNIMIGNVRTNEKISLGELFASYRSMRLTLLSHSSNEEKGIKRFHFSHSKFSNPNNIMIGNVRTNEEISLGELFASFYSLRIDRSMRMTSVELTYTSLLLCLSCATNGGKGAVYETFPRWKRAVIAHVRDNGSFSTRKRFVYRAFSAIRRAG